MPSLEKSGSNGIEEPKKSYSSQNRDLESGKPISTPQTPTFPGASYGFNPSDQPSHPPRRVQSIHSLKRNQSLGSLHTNPNAPPPLPTAYSNQNPPQTANTTTSQHQDAADDASLAEELAWGPSHPCYPHLNPHVPLNSLAYKTTRVIRIRRDWMVAGDLAPTYSNVYPEILDPLLPEPEFRHIIDYINNTLLDAFDPFSAFNWIDGMLGLLTGWLWEDFRPNVGAKGKLRGLEKWMDEWNERVGARDHVKLIPLRRTGYMELDIQIPDPQVRVVDGDGPTMEEMERRLQQSRGNTYSQTNGSASGLGLGDDESL